MKATACCDSPIPVEGSSPEAILQKMHFASCDNVPPPAEWQAGPASYFFDSFFDSFFSALRISVSSNRTVIAASPLRTCESLTMRV